MTSLNIGLGGVRRHGCAAVTDGDRVLGVCEQERVTRVRGAGFNPTGVPDEALDTILGGLRARRSDIARCGVAEDSRSSGPWATVRLDHHQAHACAAYLTSPFRSAVIVICDHEQPGVSVWRGEEADVSAVPFRWSGSSLSDLYSQCASALGFSSDAGDQRFEALARMMAADPDDRLEPLFSTDGSGIGVKQDWQEQVRARVLASSETAGRARLAAALQAQIVSLALQFLSRVKAETGAHALCLGGSLFFHSSINSAIRQSALFDRVFIPVSPGNAGLAVGSAMHVSGMGPSSLSAFIGPEYDPDEIKATLDNCKLRYDWLDDTDLVATTVEHLKRGELVGWYEGRMEWGPRALGARSILANPFSPYVLENLNRFLKRREAWRGYAISALIDAVPEHFLGPEDSPYMECDYRPKDVERFRSVMPAPAAHIRVQTVGAEAPRRFRSVLSSFGRAVGVSCLVNTSFNGFHEPIVCSPRDAVRVFFGSGLDVLIMDQFVITK